MKIIYASGQMTIQINQLQAGERFSLQLFNILGQEMHFLSNVNVPLHQEALPQLQAGVYLYHIRSSNGRIVKGKLLVN